MTPVGSAALRVDSQLRLVVDGLESTVVADGQRLTLHTPDAGMLLARASETVRALPGSAGSWRDVAGRLATALDETGLSGRVVAPGGTVVELGHGCGSRAGRLVFGSERAALGAPGAVLRAVTRYAWVSPLVRRRLAYVAAGPVIAVLLAGVRSRRRGIVP